MRCSKCGRENRAGRKFCAHCGVGLKLVCPSCQAENEPGEQFCGDCGKRIAEPSEAPPSPNPRSYTPSHLAERILAEQAAMESRGARDGERKTITALFADIKGSVELMEGLDPEEARAIVDPALHLMMDAVHRYEGYVAQSRGDGIFALFGAPIAQQDHAQRALYAALRMQEEIKRYSDRLRIEKGVPLQIRVGLNSGEMVLRSIRKDDLHTDYVPIGHSVNLAARMEALATPGTIAVSESTHRATQGYFGFRELGPVAVKGVSEPVRMYELEGVGPMRTALEISRSRGFSRFVGREREMALLEDALERTLQGNGQVVGVVAGPGIGKSRLCLEFVERCRARSIFVNEGHCPAHGKTIPYLPILELWRSYFGITEKDPDEEARRKIAGALLLFDPGLHETLPLLFEFLGVTDPDRPPPPMDPEAKQWRLFDLLRSVVQLHSDRQPAVVLIDDLHWIDPASDSWVEQLAEITNGRRFLLLVNFRPEYDGSWMKRSWYQQLPLLPLGAEAIEELLDDLLGRGPELLDLRERIRERTRGNPFFVEEVVQSLSESGSLEGTKGGYRLTHPIDAIEIPTTVHAVLAARIDRLPPREKELLQSAAVIGKTFPESILRRVAALSESELRASLAPIERAELVFAEALYPEAEYAFKHPLTHEVAYGSQLSERRTRVHAVVARAIQDTYPEKLDERAALVAHHWECASERLEAARWYKRAAEWVGCSSPPQSVQHLRRVVDLVRNVDDESAATLGLSACLRALRLGLRADVSDTEAAELLAEGRALAERAGDRRLLARVLASYGAFRGGTSRALEYLEMVAEADRIATDLQDVDLAVGLAFDRAFSLVISGRVRDAFDSVARDLALIADDATIGRRSFDEPGSLDGYLRAWRAQCLVYIGPMPEAAAAVAEVIALARDRNDAELGVWMRCARVELAEMTGEVEQALFHGREVVAAAESLGSPYWRCYAYAALGSAHLLHAEWNEAATALEHSAAIARDKQARFHFEPRTLAKLADVYRRRGEPARALATAEQAIAFIEETGSRWFECEARLALSRALVAAKGLPVRRAAEDVLERAFVLVCENGFASYRPFIHFELAELAKVAGEGGRREQELREAHRLFTEIGAPIRAEQVARELGS